MAPLRVSTTKSEWLPDDPTAFVPTRLWKLPFITTWDDSRNQNRPTDSAEEAENDHVKKTKYPFWDSGRLIGPQYPNGFHIVGHYRQIEQYTCRVRVGFAAAYTLFP